MAVIQSGATSDQLTIDPTSLAARESLYDGTGRSLMPKYLSVFQFQIVVRQSAATGAGAVVFGVYNSSGTRKVIITRAQLQLFFDGTAAATLMKYELAKLTGVTVFSGGVAPAAVLKSTALGQPTGAIARVLDTGLTTTGIATQGLWVAGAMGRVTQTTTNFQSVIVNLDFSMGVQPGIELLQNEVWAIRNNVTSVIGDNINGWVEGYEY